MQREVSQIRAAASFTNTPCWYLETGNYKNHPTYSKQVAENIQNINKYKSKIYHKYMANKPIDEVCSVARRWYYKTVGRGNQALIIYDYIKMTGEKIGINFSEFQVIGEKINRLNELGAQLNVGLFAAMQMNRTAEAGTDDSSAIALSDRLQWFCCFNAIFRRKTPEEISQDGLQFGTHKMIPIALRFEGRDHYDFVNVGTKKSPKYKYNFINYDVKNFKIEEKGTLKEIVAFQKDKHKIQEPNPNDSDDGAI